MLLTLGIGLSGNRLPGLIAGPLTGPDLRKGSNPCYDARAITQQGRNQAMNPFVSVSVRVSLWKRLFGKGLLSA